MATNQVATIDETPSAQLAAFRSNLERRAKDFAMVLPAHITPEKFQRTVLTAVSVTPDLLKADRQSLLIACMKAAQDQLLPDGREAALVVFKTNKKVGSQWEQVLLVQYMPMVYGLRKKILQSKEIADITCNVVYAVELADGAFIWEEGTGAMLRHRPSMFLSDAETADDQIVAAYSIATTTDGLKSVEVMRRFEINKVRETSQTGAENKVIKYGNDAGKTIPPKGPWVDWFPEMAKKTVMRRHSKSLPMSGDLIDVEAMDAATAARSTLSLIDSTVPDAPQRISKPELGYDPDTGEISSETSENSDSSTVIDEKTVRDNGKNPPDQAISETKKPPRKAREPKPERESGASPGGPAPDGDDQALPGEREDNVAAKIEAAIHAAQTVLDVSNITISLPTELSDDVKAYLANKGRERAEQIRAAATKAAANG